MDQKTVLIICLTSLVSLSIPMDLLQAQNSKNLSFLAGLNIAEYTNAPSGQDPRIGFTAGFYLPVNLPFPGWSVQPGLMYSQKGVQEQGVTVEVNYIQIPVVGRYSFNRANNASPYLMLGPYASFVLDAKAKNPDGSTQRFDNAESDIGITGGLGLDISLPGSSLFLEARYEAGLTDAFGEGLIIALDADNWKNRVFALALGVKM